MQNQGLEVLGGASSVGYAVRNRCEGCYRAPWSRRVFTHHLDAAIGWRCSVKPAMAHSLVRTTRTQCLPLSLTRARGGSRWIAAVCQSAALPFDAQAGIWVNSFTGQVTGAGLVLPCRCEVLSIRSTYSIA